MDYISLQSAVADWLNRSDLTTVIPTFISNLESRLNRDPKVRRLTVADLTVDAEEVDLPTGLKSIDSLSHDGPVYYGDVEIVPVDRLSDYQTPSYPRVAALSQVGKLMFAPVPDDTYTLRLSYWKGVTPLSTSALTNWLLDDHPDIYLYGSLIESAPYIREDERLQTWVTEYAARLEELHQLTERQQYGGSLVRRSRHPIP